MKVLGKLLLAAIVFVLSVAVMQAQTCPSTTLGTVYTTHDDGQGPLILQGVVGPGTNGPYGNGAGVTIFTPRDIFHVQVQLNIAEVKGYTDILSGFGGCPAGNWQWSWNASQTLTNNRTGVVTPIFGPQGSINYPCDYSPTGVPSCGTQTAGLPPSAWPPWDFKPLSVPIGITLNVGTYTLTTTFSGTAGGTGWLGTSKPYTASVTINIRPGG